MNFANRFAIRDEAAPNPEPGGKGKLSCESIARAALGDPARRSGAELFWKCPRHDDAHPSLQINPAKNKWLCGPCGASGGAWALAAFLSRSDASDKPSVTAWLREHGQLPDRANGKPKPGSKRIVATYNYLNENSKLLFQVLRYEPKDFRQRRLDGKGGWTWNLDGTRRVLYNLAEVSKAESILVCEGEKDVETARRVGLTATCNPSGAGKWKPEYSESLRGKAVIVICDADPPGLAHGRNVARSLVGIAKSVRLIEALPQAKDLTEWVAKGGTRESLLAIIKAAPELTAADTAKWTAEPATPWANAEDMAAFLSGSEDDAEFLDHEGHFLVRECVTEIFSPRGLGKSLVALSLALACANRGLRTLYIDRDNPRRVLKSRLRAFGASLDTANLKIIPREKCPPLTKAQAWASFPYAEYDVVMLDSFDAAAEGIGEQSSEKPSKAIAPVLDICRRENGPAFLILGNTIKSAAHSRGSGVIEDRADIVYEVRDASGFHPSGSKPWIEELPAADAGSWASRASRRKQREIYRLAFVASKFRIAEEPEPFILEIDTTANPWTVRDVTNEVDREGAEAREQRAKEKAEAVQRAVRLLTVEVKRRDDGHEPDILKKQAEEFLTANGLTRRVARETLKSPAFDIMDVPGKGNPKAVRLACIKDESGRNDAITEPAKIQGESDTHFGRPVFMHPAEIDPPGTRVNSGLGKHAISADDSIYTTALRQKSRPEAAEIPPQDVEVL